MKYTYSVQVLSTDKWFSLIQGESKGFAEGYYRGRVDARTGVSLAIRLIRDQDQKILDSRGAVDQVGIGMTAGFPTPEQFEAAAQSALEMAERLRKAKKRRESMDSSGDT